MSLTENKSGDPVAQDSGQIPFVESPYEGRHISVAQHLTLSSFWFATNFLWGALLVIMLPGELRKLAPFYRAEAIGLLTMLSALVAVVTPLVVGALSDRCASRFGRRRPYIAAGTLINIAGLTCMSVAYGHGLAHPIPAATGPEPRGPALDLMLLGHPTFLNFLLCYMLVQLGNNVASAAYCGIIPDLVPANQRGAASGYMALMSQLGTLFGGAACFALGSRPEFAKYALLCVVLLAIGGLTIFGVKENPLPRKAPKIDWNHYLRSLWIDPRKYPDFAWVWITRALVMLGFYSILPFVNYYLIDVIGVAKPEGPSAALMGVILLASSFTGVAGGYVSDRIGRKRVVYLSNSLIAVMALAFIFCRSIPQVLLAGVCFGLGFGAYTSVDWALGTDVLPNKKDAAKEMAVWHIAMTLPQTAAAWIAGQLIASGGKTIGPATEAGGDPSVHYAIRGYSAVFIFVAICFALGAYLLKNVRGVR